MFTEVIPTIPRVYTALAEWSACVIYILILNKNAFNLKMAGRLSGGLGVLVLIQLIAGELPAILWIPGMAAAVLAMTGLIRLCTGVGWKEAFYNEARAFLAAELAASLEWQIYHFQYYGKSTDTILMRAMVLVVCYLCCFSLVYLLERRVRYEGKVLKISDREMVTAVLMGCITFGLSNLSFVYANTPFTSPVEAEIFNIRTLMDLSGFAILYAYHALVNELHLRYEKDTMENMLQNQMMQYKLSRESIDLINRKYHDLKHQIAVLRRENNEEKRNQFLDEMESEIRVYEAQNKTGNSILDTVLTSKSLYCLKHQISITSVVDGSLLSFMDVMDICTIFGNALDNAIECELRIPQKEKRLIHLTVSAQKEFLILRFENYCEEELKLMNGIPQTSKQDNGYHGFGVRSIQQSAEKYGGTIRISQEKNWFCLLIMIPMPETQS
ncbi:MAG: ATP-binding protein [Lachnospiraceae bacterium]|nr:ATP-binding protein [Lachnospiraceae bacterium]